LVPVENFSQLIRAARVERGMSQQDVAQRINERASVIGKLESGKMSVCTIKLARKLERLFKLTLLEYAEPLDLSAGSESSKTTLGDVVEIRRKKPKS
jgi:putative transcription factor